MRTSIFAADGRFWNYGTRASIVVSPLTKRAYRVLAWGRLIREAAHMDKEKRRISYVVGPDGLVLTRASLPRSRNTRWVARRKAEVVLAVSGGILSITEACASYAISTDEFMEWERSYMQRGLPGLRAKARPDHESSP